MNAKSEIIKKNIERLHDKKAKACIGKEGCENYSKKRYIKFFLFDC